MPFNGNLFFGRVSFNGNDAFDFSQFIFDGHDTMAAGDIGDGKDVFFHFSSFQETVRMKVNHDKSTLMSPIAVTGYKVCDDWSFARLSLAKSMEGSRESASS